MNDLIEKIKGLKGKYKIGLAAILLITVFVTVTLSTSKTGLVGKKAPAITTIKLVGKNVKKLDEFELLAQLELMKKAINGYGVEQKKRDKEAEQSQIESSNKVVRLEKKINKLVQLDKAKEVVELKKQKEFKKEIRLLNLKLKNNTSIVINKGNNSNKKGYMKQTPVIIGSKYSQENQNPGVFITPTYENEDISDSDNELTLYNMAFLETEDTDNDGVFNLVEDIDFNNTNNLFVLPSNDIAIEETDEEIEEELAKNKELYLPMGSIISGTLLTGGDFPTSIAHKNDPYPVLLRVKNLAILPNFAEADIKECFVLAEGFGVLSSERAMIRGVGISCVRDDGGVVEAKLNAYATGSDGKIGIRGRHVSKEGAMVGKSMLAGFVSGIATAFNPSNYIAPVDANSSSSATAKNIGLSGIAGGTSNSMEKLSEYFIKMADQIFSIIEVDAGRKVEFILKQGVGLQVKK